MAGLAAHGLTPGCSGTIPARYFDGDEEFPCSEVEFGDQADSMQLKARVECRVRNTICVNVAYDGTR